MAKPTGSPLSDRDLQFLQMGRAQQIPGIQRAIDILQASLAEIKAEMYQIQDLLEKRHAPALAQERRLEAPARRGRPPGKQPRAKAAAGYWANLTPEERSVEMKRRQAVAAAKVPGKKLHPRDKEHPEHEKWRAKMAKATRKRWKSYSPQEQKRQVKRMVAGRRPGVPEVTLERSA